MNKWLTWGAGPRASMNLILAAKAHAILRGQHHVAGDDVVAVAMPILRHRLIPNFAAQSEGVTVEEVIQKLIAGGAAEPSELIAVGTRPGRVAGQESSAASLQRVTAGQRAGPDTGLHADLPATRRPRPRRGPRPRRPGSVVEGLRVGDHKSPFRGFSVEFVQHREYVPGDDIRHIDWKSYGRTERYTIKQYEQETNFVAHILLDASEVDALRRGRDEQARIRQAARRARWPTSSSTSATRAALRVFDDGWRGRAARLAASRATCRRSSARSRRSTPRDKGTIGPLLSELAAAGPPARPGVPHHRLLRRREEPADRPAAPAVPGPRGDGLPRPAPRRGRVPLLGHDAASSAWRTRAAC